MIEHVIARYGEISLKGRNRSDFERILVQNIRNSLYRWPQTKIDRVDGRIRVTLNDAPMDGVIACLQDVFGIVSLSPVEVTGLDLEEVVAAASRVLQDQKVDKAEPTFKVEAKRTNKQFPMTSPEVAARVGGDLLESVEQWKVDVRHPDVTVYVEIRDAEALVYGSKVPGLGGMPVRSAGKVGLLLSGGIDSPVAGWLALKRGVELEAIHFHSFPFTSERALQKVETLAQILANWGGRVRLHTVHFTEVQTEIRKHCPEELSITIMRRMMMRIATEISNRCKLLALVTGESLGQVASQTLESMQVINAVTNIPVLRPLISEDKLDIIARARRIGTYETSILPYEDCCTVFVPTSPRTRPRLSEAESAEQNLAVDELVAAAVERTTTKVFTVTRED
jgi:tRNA uracil 4-sulfurtransferase